MNNVINKDHIAHLKKNGFVVIPRAIDKQQVKDTCAEIWTYLEMSPSCSDSWYDSDLRQKSGIDKRGVIPFYHGSELWKNRQNSNIYQIFRTIFQEEKLHVSIDRVNMNPPVTESWEYRGFLHFDVDTSQHPIPRELQGILSLTDVNEISGGFQCIPGFHNIVDDWIKTRPKDEDPRFPDFSGYQPVNVLSNAGDLIIFDARLPHGNTPNQSELPRMAQYITMWPAKQSRFDVRRRRDCIFNKSAPRTRMNRLLPDSPKPQTYSDVQLTLLGCKLVGIECWNDF
jgi:hypothetical protein